VNGWTYSSDICKALPTVACVLPPSPSLPPYLLPLGEGAHQSEHAHAGLSATIDHLPLRPSLPPSLPLPHPSLPLSLPPSSHPSSISLGKGGRQKGGREGGRGCLLNFSLLAKARTRRSVPMQASVPLLVKPSYPSLPSSLLPSLPDISHREREGGNGGGREGGAACLPSPCW